MSVAPLHFGAMALRWETELFGQWMWLWLVLAALPLVLLAWSKRIYPHLPLLILMAFPTLATPLLFLNSDLAAGVVLVDLVLLVLAAADLISLPSAAAFRIQRDVLRIASLQVNHRVTLIVANQSRRSHYAWLRDDLPQELEAHPPEFSLRLLPRSRSTMHYDFRALRRGAYSLPCVHLKIRSRFGLWLRYLTLPCESRVHVYPDMRQLSEYAILARTNRLTLMGVRRTRRIGQDNEFERLRDYTPDDNYKHIEWRTTARRNKLTVKDYQVNQSQRLIFLLDCGRMMTNLCANLSLLDHSLNAMLMLSHVALRQGDSVGLMCFSDQIHAYVPPRGGMTQMNRLIHASFDRFPKLVESRYDEAFLYLSAHCRKRSLIILVTNLIDEVNSLQVYQYLSSIVGRHLPLIVLLRDHQLFDVADQTRPAPGQLFQAAAAAEIVTWRHQVLNDLEHRGVLALDVFPEHMTAPLVNRYLDIKARHLL